MTCLTEADEREKQHAEALKSSQADLARIHIECIANICYLVPPKKYQKTLQRRCIAQNETWHDFIFTLGAVGDI